MRLGMVSASEIARKKSLLAEDHLGLKSSLNTKGMERRIRAAATEWGNGRPNEVFYEHGQWWVRWGRAHYSVVDQEGGDEVDGFGFERID